MNRKIFLTALASLCLIFLTLTPSLADLPVDPNFEQRMLEKNLEKEIKGLSKTQQVERVKEMLAEIPLRKAELDRQYSDPENRTPKYMLGKQKASLDRKAAFLRQWLTEQGQVSKNPDGTVLTHEDHIPSPSPLSPCLALGGCFLLGAMLIGARRFLSTGSNPA